MNRVTLPRVPPEVSITYPPWYITPDTIACNRFFSLEGRLLDDEYRGSWEYTHAKVCLLAYDVGGWGTKEGVTVGPLGMFWGGGKKVLTRGCGQIVIYMGIEY